MTPCHVSYAMSSFITCVSLATNPSHLYCLGMSCSHKCTHGLITCVSHILNTLVHIGCHSITKTKLGTFHLGAPNQLWLSTRKFVLPLWSLLKSHGRSLWFTWEEVGVGRDFKPLWLPQQWGHRQTFVALLNLRVNHLSPLLLLSLCLFLVWIAILGLPPDRLI
jgi:hypothetical protein